MKERRLGTRFLTVLVGGLVLVGCMDPTLSGSGMVTSSLSIADAPLGVSEIDIRIRGKGFTPKSFTLTPNTDAIVLELPVGKARLFEGRGGTYFARTVAAITPNGANVGLNFSPVLIVPDTDNSRLVQVWRPDQPAWAESDPGVVSGFFFPTDVDFDAGGRIYVANDSTGGGVGLFRLDSIYDTTGDSLGGAAVVESVAVDRERNLVYVLGITGGGIPVVARSNLGGGSQVQLDVSGISTSSKIAIDGDGFLYISDGSQSLQKYNPGTETTVTSTSVSFGSIADVHVVGSFVYVALSGLEAGQAPILRLSLDLAFAGSIGTIAADPAALSPGELYGPTGFVTDRRGLLVVMDSTTDVDDNAYDRLVFINPSSPAVSTTYGSNGSGEGQFRF